MISQIVLFLHVIGATVLLGTGAGIAFFMLMAHRSGDPKFIANTAGTVVVADFLFTATAALAQPITGLLLVWLQGYSLADLWIWLSLVLYVLVGCFWLPVVWIQMRLHRLANEAVAGNDALGQTYHRLFRLWFWLGVPAFFSVLGIIWLMLSKPV